jgi:hypothetical protein
MIEEKFVCAVCGFESNGLGLCPTCDENLQKVCYCGSGKFSSDCCGSNESAEKKVEEDIIKAEVSGEALTEKATEDVKKQKEEDDLANVEEVND